MYGGGGNDLFVIDALDKNNPVKIWDLNLSQDTITLANILEVDFDPVNHAIEDFISMRSTNGDDIYLSVDVDGAGGSAEAVDVAVIYNVGVPTLDLQAISLTVEYHV